MTSLSDLNKLKPQALYHCVGCGWCCKQLFGKRFGAAILPIEKMRLERLAQAMGVSVNFAPLTRDVAGVVTTYQFTDNKCPFLKGSECGVYNSRPLLCKAFPLMPYGVADCTGLERQTRAFNVKYTPQQVEAGTAYLKQVGDALKHAAWRYNLDKERWEFQL